MYTPNLVSILFYDQPLRIFKFDDIMPTSRIISILAEGVNYLTLRVQFHANECNEGEMLTTNPNEWNEEYLPLPLYRC